MYEAQAGSSPHLSADFWRPHAREAHVLSFRVQRRPGRTPEFDILGHVNSPRCKP